MSSTSPPPAMVLIVEDDATIAEQVRARLQADGHRVTVVGDGREALAMADRLGPDVIVLDLMLPGLHGLEVCQRLRASSDAAVLMLTALDAEVDVVVGLRMGADDYLAKPFSPRELSARVDALLRRVRRTPAPMSAAVARAGRWRVDPGRRLVTDGETSDAALTATEFELLLALARRPGQVRTRRELVTEVWGHGGEAVQRTVDSHVRAIRGKLGEDVIRTVRGVGYAAAEPVGDAARDGAGR